MRMNYLLLFQGEGRCSMSGVKEYVVITDDPKNQHADYVAPGFKLVETIIFNDPGNVHLFPMNRELIPQA